MRCPWDIRDLWPATHEISISFFSGRNWQQMSEMYRNAYLDNFWWLASALADHAYGQKHQYLPFQLIPLSRI